MTALGVLSLKGHLNCSSLCFHSTDAECGCRVQLVVTSLFLPEPKERLWGINPGFYNISRHLRNAVTNSGDVPRWSMLCGFQLFFLVEFKSLHPATVSKWWFEGKVSTLDCCYPSTGLCPMAGACLGNTPGSLRGPTGPSLGPTPCQRISKVRSHAHHALGPQK